MELQVLDMIFFLIAGIGWSVAYVVAIVIGFKHKTYCIPFVPLALNFSWEIVASIDYPVLNVYSAVYIVWALLDTLILVTYLSYGKTDYHQFMGEGKFGLWTVLVLAVAFAWQIINSHYTYHWLIVTAFNMNLLMSVAFILMLRLRRNSRGQSMIIAVSKCIGTLGNTLQGYSTMDDSYMAGIGTLCFVFDIIYIVLLYKTIQSEKVLAIQSK